MPSRRGGKGRRSERSRAEDQLLSELLQRLASEDREAFDALVTFIERLVNPRRSKDVDKS